MTIISIGGGHSLEMGAAASFARVSKIRPGLLSRINSSYRSNAEQAVLRKAYEASLRGGPKAAFALKPGQSKHNDGTALDLDSTPWNADHQWMVDHGEEHGWWRPTEVPGYKGAREPWHFEYRAHLDQHINDLTAPTVTARKKAKMLHFYINDPKSARGVKYVILTHDGRRIDYTSGAQDFPNAVAANIGNAILADEALITAFQKQLRASGPPVAAITQAAADTKPIVDAINAIPAKVVAAFKALTWAAR